MSNKNLMYGLSLIGVVLLLIIGLFFFASNQESGDISVTPTPFEEPSLITSPTPSTSTEIPEDWETYESTSLELSVSHSPDMTVEETEDGLSLRIFGPSQREGTEVYDGIVINISQGIHEEDSLQEFVQNERDEQAGSPVGAEVSEVTEVEIAGREGYQFTVISLGEFTHYYLPKNEGEYLFISLLVEDPENQGFEEIVDNIFASIQFN